MLGKAPRSRQAESWRATVNTAVQRISDDMDSAPSDVASTTTEHEQSQNQRKKQIHEASALPPHMQLAQSPPRVSQAPTVHTLNAHTLKVNPDNGRGLTPTFEQRRRSSQLSGISRASSQMSGSSIPRKARRESTPFEEEQAATVRGMHEIVRVQEELGTAISGYKHINDPQTSASQHHHANYILLGCRATLAHILSSGRSTTPLLKDTSSVNAAIRRRCSTIDQTAAATASIALTASIASTTPSSSTVTSAASAVSPTAAPSSLYPAYNHRPQISWTETVVKEQKIEKAMERLCNDSTPFRSLSSASSSSSLCQDDQDFGDVDHLLLMDRRIVSLSAPLPRQQRRVLHHTKPSSRLHGGQGQLGRGKREMRPQDIQSPSDSESDLEDVVPQPSSRASSAAPPQSKSRSRSRNCSPSAESTRRRSSKFSQYDDDVGDDVGDDDSDIHEDYERDRNEGDLKFGGSSSDNEEEEDEGKRDRRQRTQERLASVVGTALQSRARCESWQRSRSQTPSPAPTPIHGQATCANGLLSPAPPSPMRPSTCPADQSSLHMTCSLSPAFPTGSNTTSPFPFSEFDFASETETDYLDTREQTEDESEADTRPPSATPSISSTTKESPRLAALRGRRPQRPSVPTVTECESETEQSDDKSEPTEDGGDGVDDVDGIDVGHSVCSSLPHTQSPDSLAQSPLASATNLSRSTSDRTTPSGGTGSLVSPSSMHNTPLNPTTTRISPPTTLAISSADDAPPKQRRLSYVERTRRDATCGSGNFADGLAIPSTIVRPRSFCGTEFKAPPALEAKTSVPNLRVPSHDRFQSKIRSIEKQVQESNGRWQRRLSDGCLDVTRSLSSRTSPSPARLHLSASPDGTFPTPSVELHRVGASFLSSSPHSTFVRSSSTTMDIERAKSLIQRRMVTLSKTKKKEPKKRSQRLTATTEFAQCVDKALTNLDEVEGTMDLVSYSSVSVAIEKEVSRVSSKLSSTALVSDEDIEHAYQGLNTKNTAAIDQETLVHSLRTHKPAFSEVEISLFVKHFVGSSDRITLECFQKLVARVLSYHEVFNKLIEKQSQPVVQATPKRKKKSTRRPPTFKRLGSQRLIRTRRTSVVQHRLLPQASIEDESAPDMMTKAPPALVRMLSKANALPTSPPATLHVLTRKRSSRCGRRSRTASRRASREMTSRRESETDPQHGSGAGSTVDLIDEPTSPSRFQRTASGRRQRSFRAQGSFRRQGSKKHGSRRGSRTRGALTSNDEFQSMFDGPSSPIPGSALSPCVEETCDQCTPVDTTSTFTTSIGTLRATDDHFEASMPTLEEAPDESPVRQGVRVYHCEPQRSSGIHVRALKALKNSFGQVRRRSESPTSKSAQSGGNNPSCSHSPSPAMCPSIIVDVEATDRFSSSHTSRTESPDRHKQRSAESGPASSGTIKTSSKSPSPSCWLSSITGAFQRQSTAARPSSQSIPEEQEYGLGCNDQSEQSVKESPANCVCEDADSGCTCAQSTSHLVSASAAAPVSPDDARGRADSAPSTSSRQGLIAKHTSRFRRRIKSLNPTGRFSRS
eukprot:m.246682 g.246682  ORF g.246682 m.246682 type:complete len:1548 (-) comp15383_c2_seq3:376-5019(-)